MPCARHGLSLLPVTIIDPAVNTRLTGCVEDLRQIDEVAAASSLMRWWDDVGVDVAIRETPFDWLGTARPPHAVVATPLASAHATLDTLIAHLMTTDFPEVGPAHRRLRPSGDRSSALMILADQPDVADIEEARPLVDPIFEKMLAALGHGRDTVYIAFLSPGRPDTGRLSDETIMLLAGLAIEHIAFVNPKQLWLMGGAASRAVLGIDDAAAKGKLHAVNHSAGKVNAVATAHPRMFAGSKARKAAAWAEMQRLIAKEDA